MWKQFAEGGRDESCKGTAGWDRLKGKKRSRGKDDTHSGWKRGLRELEARTASDKGARPEIRSSWSLHSSLKICQEVNSSIPRGLTSGEPWSGPSVLLNERNGSSSFCTRFCPCSDSCLCYHSSGGSTASHLFHVP